MVGGRGLAGSVQSPSVLRHLDVGTSHGNMEVGRRHSSVGMLRCHIYPWQRAPLPAFMCFTVGQRKKLSCPWWSMLSAPSRTLYIEAEMQPRLLNVQTNRIFMLIWNAVKNDIFRSSIIKEQLWEWAKKKQTSESSCWVKILQRTDSTHLSTRNILIMCIIAEA